MLAAECLVVEGRPLVDPRGPGTVEVAGIVARRSDQAQEQHLLLIVAVTRMVLVGVWYLVVVGMHQQVAAEGNYCSPVARYTIPTDIQVEGTQAVRILVGSNQILGD